MSFLKKTSLLVFALAVALTPTIAEAYTFEGYLANSSGVPVTGSVYVQLFVKSPGAEACLLYQEKHAAVADAEGYISLKIGAGTRVDALGHSIDRAFGNYGSFSGLACASGTTYTPAAGATRKLFVEVGSSLSGPWEALGSLDMTPVPLASSAEKIANFGIGNLLRVESAGTPAAATAMNPTQFSDLMALIGGTSTKYLKDNGTTAGASLPVVNGNPTTPAQGSIWFDYGANQLKYHDGTTTQIVGAGGGGTITGISASAPISVVGSGTVSITISQAGTSSSGYLTSTDWNNFNNKLGASTPFSGEVTGLYTNLVLGNTGVGAGTYTKVTVDAKGRVTAGASLTSSDVTTALGFIPMGSGGGPLHVYGNSSDPSTAGWTATEKGKLWFNTTENKFKYWNGSTIQSLDNSSGGGGITSLNGLSSGTQSLEVSLDDSYASPQFVSSSAIHSLKIPSASVSGVNAGLLSKADYDNFSSKLGPGTVFSGDVTGSITGNTVNRLSGWPLNISAPISGQVLKFTGSYWVNDAAGGISGAMTVSQGGTGTTFFTANRLVGTDGTGNSLNSVSCGFGQVIGFDVSGNYGCTTLDALSGIINGGNSVSADLTIGTNSVYGFKIKTNGVDQLYVDSSGAVGLGTLAPSSKLDVDGAITVRPHGVSVGMAGSIFLRELASNGVNVVNLRSPDFLASDVSLTLPNTVGANGQVLATDGTGALFWQTPSGGGLSNVGNLYSAPISVGTQDAYPVQLITNNVPRLTVSSVGEVGIGTIYPAAVLDLQANTSSQTLLRMANTSSVGKSLIQFADEVSTPQASLGYYNSSATPTPNIFAIKTIGATEIQLATNSVEVMRIGASGNVGIGTSNPYSRLDVMGALTLSSTGGSAGMGGKMQFKEWSSYGSDTITVEAPESLSATYALKLPATPPTTGQVLMAQDGTGLLQWANFGGGGPEGTAGANSTSVSFFSNERMYLETSTGGNLTLNDMSGAGKRLTLIVRNTGGTGITVGINASGTSNTCANIKMQTGTLPTLPIGGERVFEIYIRDASACYVKWTDF